ncbi:hypothetical protein FHW67_002725 [Herbaspirillum sp. Sphag1AN]|uniref:hypothetical protein n=1 Tax=unclassified Herbaspirillum TaxID=2624150 RepID=UPI0016220FD1|nr:MULTISPECIES: hypothetical protein [unclassified Herbaspirillum]MBB3213433.1 hypothetical protein [Herbaspirillum sp. Sphag1AN]MBB3246523.1 hypothetical protein [Herbaspirillum sp. Sphag64]
MADISDVLVVLTAQAAAAVYPNGTGQASVAGCDVRLYPGWPNATALDADLLAGKVHVSVYPTQSERNVSRYDRRWQPQTRNVPTITLTQTGANVTVGGLIPSPFFSQNLAILIGANGYTYPVQAADTLTTIATALSQQIPGASSSGAVITLPAGPTPILRVGSTGTAIQEIRRQKRLMQVTIWAPTPTLRDSVAQAVDVALSTLTFLTMPDGMGARIIYQDSPMTDSLQKAKLYRRDLRYNVEFATTKQMNTAEVVVGVVTQQTTTTGVIASVKTY